MQIIVDFLHIYREIFSIFVIMFFMILNSATLLQI